MVSLGRQCGRAASLIEQALDWRSQRSHLRRWISSCRGVSRKPPFQLKYAIALLFPGQVCAAAPGSSRHWLQPRDLRRGGNWYRPGARHARQSPLWQGISPRAELARSLYTAQA
jgi:hypothetical protein